MYRSESNKIIITKSGNLFSVSHRQYLDLRLSLRIRKALRCNPSDYISISYTILPGLLYTTCHTPSGICLCVSTFSWPPRRQTQLTRLMVRSSVAWTSLQQRPLEGRPGTKEVGSIKNPAKCLCLTIFAWLIKYHTRWKGDLKISSSINLFTLRVRWKYVVWCVHIFENNSNKFTKYSKESYKLSSD